MRATGVAHPAAAPVASQIADSAAFLARLGDRGAVVYRVDWIRPDLVWIAYVTAGREPRTAVAIGVEPADWTRLRDMDGWPCPPISSYEGNAGEA